MLYTRIRTGHIYLKYFYLKDRQKFLRQFFFVFCTLVKHMKIFCILNNKIDNQSYYLNYKIQETFNLSILSTKYVILWGAPLNTKYKIHLQILFVLNKDISNIYYINSVRFMINKNLLLCVARMINSNIYQFAIQHLQ